jgi:hypothetical protein
MAADFAAAVAGASVVAVAVSAAAEDGDPMSS